MTKEIHQQQSQPLHASIVGLALLLGWLVAGHLFVSAGNQDQTNSHGFHIIYNLAFRQLIFWKLYTLIAFIFGIRAYIYTETESTIQLFYFRSLLWVVTAALLSFINLMALGLIPLIVFGVLLFRIREISSQAQFIGLGILLFFVAFVVWYSGFPNFEALCFSGFASNNSDLNFSEILMVQIKDPSNQVAWIFGFMVMIIGYAIGKAKWLLEYHFHYVELRRLFFISIGLIAIWSGLIYFNYYNFLFQYRIGRIFYLLDALSVHLITLFVYLFVLIYFENFRIGIMINRVLAQTGKLWFFNLLFLFCMILLANFFQWSFAEGISLTLGLSGFAATSVVSYIALPHLPKKFEFFY